MKRTNLQHASFSRPGFSALVLGGIFIAGCLLEPVGVNKAVGSLPRVAPGQVLELPFPVPAEATKATFSLVLPEGVEASPPVIPADETIDDGFVALVPTVGLPKNFYEVQMFVGEEELLAATRSFVIADPTATDTASPDSATPTPSASATTSPGPSPSPSATTSPSASPTPTTPSASVSAATSPSPSPSASVTPSSSPSTGATTTPGPSPSASATTTPAPSPSTSPAAWRVSARFD